MSMDATYTQIYISDLSGKTQTAWIPSEKLPAKILKIKGKVWKILEVYSSLKATLIEKYPKDFKVVIPE